MKKRITSLLLAFLMVITIAQPAMAYAQVGMNSQGNDVKALQTMLNTVDNVRVSSGCPVSNPLRDNPHFKMEGTWTDVYSVSSGAHSSYTTDSVGLSGDFAAKKRQLAQLLDQHPEGVVFYAKYPGSQHAITVSDYEIKSDGDYQFYAYDPVNVRNYGVHRIRMENTYLCSCNGSLSKTFNNLYGIDF